MYKLKKVTDKFIFYISSNKNNKINGYNKTTYGKCYFINNIMKGLYLGRVEKNYHI